ncbi:MAG TPA: hypothetical protein VK437_13010 [Steroidobacteraceae bacterium]|nr:hypothetical protein [Steroidobacteraceae bacterium]
MLVPDLPFIRAVHEPPAAERLRYVIGAMMTANHADYGERLAASCRAHSLPLALFELPAVHRSISRNGSGDLRCTKANFANFLLHRYGCPVLYVDVDCRIVQHPERIERLIAERVDFAIFNWLAEEHTEAYVPVSVPYWDGVARRVSQDRFYQFSHSIDFASETQLLCSGLVQWYANTEAARGLLARWQEVIERSPGSADDKCLDFAFNNHPSGAMKVHWLEKRYARYAWWIYERPVIDHPQQPYSGEGFVPIEEMDGRRRVYVESLERRQVPYVFPKDCLIDTETRKLYRMHQNAWREAGAVSVPLWL